MRIATSLLHFSVTSSSTQINVAENSKAVGRVNQIRRGFVGEGFTLIASSLSRVFVDYVKSDVIATQAAVC